jgi:hypothetical protein
VKFINDDLVSSYFLKIAQIRDQLVAIDESVPDRDLVLTSMGGCPPEWKLLVKEICARG